MNELSLGGDYNLKINSKKLKSGKCQVKFHAEVNLKRKLYGYMLAESGEKLNNVVEKIITRLDRIKSRENYHHINLYKIGNDTKVDSGFMIFDV